MSRAKAGVRQTVRCGALAITSILIASTVLTSPADARRRHRAQPAQSYQPPYASIVVDANTGAVLQSSDADSPRHPASLTKIMTLYLLFERLEAGKIQLNTPMEASAHAAVQAPSKLNLKPGETITVEAAIRAIVTKSANDVAVVVAEALGGSEPEFARLMTKKAHELGMSHTLYRNASGLPDDEQITTARDMVVLGRAIQERFPAYYKYFSTRSFAFRGRAMRNHNKLLGEVEGVDGIKTGYTNASGFNLITSVKRGGKRIIAAVFGGRTASWRDSRMVGLIEKYLHVASAKAAPAMVADAKLGLKTRVEAKPDTKADAKAAPKSEPKPEPLDDAPKPVAQSGPAMGSNEPIKPNAVKTVLVKSAAQGPTLASAPGTAQKLLPMPASSAPVTTIATVKAEAALPPPPPGAKPGVLGVLAVPANAAPAPAAAPASMKVASAGDSLPAAAAPSSKSRGSYMIQVGAFDAEAEAKERLAVAQKAARDLLGGADPFTERASKGNKTLFRARFAGLDKEQAEAACASLKRGEIPCMVLKN